MVSAPRPVRFACQATLPLSGPAIAAQILDLARWPEFTGYAFLPGIRSAEFETRTPEVAGTRIRVTNTDGSQHVEAIVEWRPERRLQLVLHEFSRPLSALALRFVETWDFTPAASGTRVVRSFEMYARSWASLPVVWFLSRFLRRAIARHLRMMCEAGVTPPIAVTPVER